MTQHDFKQSHGFRKFFKSQSERFVKSIFVEMMIGHATGLNASYMKPTIEEMAEEYVKAIPTLTIQSAQVVKGMDEKDYTRILREQLLLALGTPKEQIQKMSLEDMEQEEFQKILGEKLRVNGINKCNKQKVIAISEVKEHIDSGFEFVASLSNGEAGVRVA